MDGGFWMQDAGFRMRDVILVGHFGAIWWFFWFFLKFNQTH